MTTQKETKIYAINIDTKVVIKKGELGTYLGISQGDNIILMHDNNIIELKKIIDEFFLDSDITEMLEEDTDLQVKIMLIQNETRIYIINDDTSAFIRKGEFSTYLAIAQDDNTITIHDDDITELKEIIDEIFADDITEMLEEDMDILVKL